MEGFTAFFLKNLLRWLIFTPGGKCLLTGICMIISMSTCVPLWKEFCCTPAPFPGLLQEPSLASFPALIGLSIFSLCFCPLCCRESIQDKKNLSFLYTHTPWILQEHWENHVLSGFYKWVGWAEKTPLLVLKAPPRSLSFKSRTKEGVEI